jgi:pilus assembly protein CpaE
VEIALNLKPQHTIADLVNQVDTLEPDIMDHALVRHASGVRVLASVPNATDADRVQPRHVSTVMSVLRSHYPWVVVDSGYWADARLEPVLEASDVILLVTTPDIASLRSARVFLQMAREQDYPPDKVRLVINRVDMPSAIPEKQLGSSLGLAPFAVLPDDPALATFSVNRGIPLVLSHPRKPLARGLTQMAEALLGEMTATAAPRGRGGLFGQKRRS